MADDTTAADAARREIGWLVTTTLGLSRQIQQRPPTPGRMSDGAETARVWLVERDYDDKGLVRLVYATPDGNAHLTRDLSQQLLRRSPVTAAMTVERGRLESVVDAETRDRYAAETDRTIAAHEPDDEV